jgi:hypothetical protein
MLYFLHYKNICTRYFLSNDVAPVLILFCFAGFLSTSDIANASEYKENIVIPSSGVHSTDKPILLRLKELERQQSSLLNTITFSAELEVESHVIQGKVDDSSDITLATAAIAIDAEVSSQISAHILLFHEEHQTQDIVIEEGFVVLTADTAPLSFIIGKQVIDFGFYESYLISSPITADFAETFNTAITFNSRLNNIVASIYVFNGDIDSSDHSHIDQYGIALGYEQGFTQGSFIIGIDYISDISESDAFLEYFDSRNINRLSHDVSAISVYSALAFKQWEASAEYIFTTQSFDDNDLNFANKDAQPSSYALALNYYANIVANDWSLTIALQGSNEAQALSLVSQKILLGASYYLHADAMLSIELAQSYDYAKNVSGTDNSEISLATQLSVAF